MTLITGTGPEMVAQKLHSESSVQLHDLGAQVHTNDGRILRYVKAGATALVMGKLQQASAEDTTNFQNLTVTAPTAGDVSITTTSTTTLTANQLAGGLLTITSATTGAGQTLRIKSHAAATAAAVTINLEDPVIFTPTGTVKIDMAPSIYQSVIVNPATATSLPIGVAVYNITAAYFGWVGINGVFSCLMDGTGVVGTEMVASNATAGAIEPLTGVQAVVGTLVTGIATTEYGLCKFKL